MAGQADGEQGLRIAITLPYLFSVWDFLFTPLWQAMAKQEQARFILLARDPAVGEMVRRRGAANIEFRRFPPPLVRPHRLARALAPLRRYVYAALMYRFAALNQLAHQQVRRQKSRAERRRQQRFYFYPLGEKAGWPAPASPTLYRLFYELHCNLLVHPLPEHLQFLRSLEADLFVFGRLHLQETAYWAGALRRLGVPAVGLVASWDHPTTQGPTCRGMSGYLVASRRMAREMAELHGVDPARIRQVGKVQMDQYRDPTVLRSREEFLGSLGLPPEQTLVTLGTNTTGLKEHEVSIARWLARAFRQGRFGQASLVIRTHPQDQDWRRDFLSLAHPPQVLCHRASGFGSGGREDLEAARRDSCLLANLMKHSAVVIQSRGSLALDAIAFDTCVISLAFDGDLQRPARDSFQQEYLYEHYKPLVAARGTWMAHSYPELERALAAYLADPGIHAPGRRLIRQEQLEPLDGGAGRRVVECLLDWAGQARQGTLPPGDWDYWSLGQVPWGRDQALELEAYLGR